MSIHRFLAAVLTCLLLFTPEIASAQVPPSAPESTPENVLGDNPSAPCYTSRLKIRDLANVDATVVNGVANATKRAKEWQADARLFTLRLVCPLLTTGVRWEGVFFSPSAQALYATDTGRIEAVEADPDTIPSLDPANVSLTTAYRSLIRGGFDDDMQLTAQGGVTIRESTDVNPFGPSTAPRGRVYAHLAVESGGQVSDVWVTLDDGTIYRYDAHT